MLEDDENTLTLQPNILQLDELLTTGADDELFGASDYLPVNFQINCHTQKIVKDFFLEV